MAQDWSIREVSTPTADRGWMGVRYLTKGAGHKMPEGGHWKPERLVIIEFPDMDSVNAWYSSTEYQPLIALRKASTSDQDMLFFLEGA